MNEHEKAAKAAQQVEAITGFYIHLIVFVLIMTLLFVINWVTFTDGDGGSSLRGWGVLKALVLGAAAALASSMTSWWIGVLAHLGLPPVVLAIDAGDERLHESSCRGHQVLGWDNPMACEN